MQLNNLVFPAPKPGYDEQHFSLFWIPKSHPHTQTSSLSCFNETRTVSIPMLFVENINDDKCKDLIIYFHGNAEDASYSEPMVEYLCDVMKAHAIIAEYPSYGVYQFEKPDENIIYANSLTLYDFAVDTLGFRPENILVIGRSLGSGPFGVSSLRTTCSLGGS